MSNLCDHAERELRAAGLYDNDSDYGGDLGPAVMELVKVFAAQGHSGYSAYRTLQLFARVASYKLLSPLQNPIEKGEYIDHSSYSGGACYQSNRLSWVFSEDGGKRWYDIDKKLPRWRRWLGQRRAYITFPYMPGAGR